MSSCKGEDVVLSNHSASLMLHEETGIFVLTFRAPRTTISIHLTEGDREKLEVLLSNTFEE